MKQLMDTQVQITDVRDPRRLRELMERAETLAREHGLRSVVVGLAGFEGDTLFPEFDLTDWKEVRRESRQADERNAYDFDFFVYERA